MLVDTLNPTVIYLFGGKDSADAVKSLLAPKTKSTWTVGEKERKRMRDWVLNITLGEFFPLNSTGDLVEDRYSHSAITVNYSSRKTESKEDGHVLSDAIVIALLYGGIRTEQFGYCSPQIYELVVMSKATGVRRKAISVDRVIDKSCKSDFDYFHQEENTCIIPISSVLSDILPSSTELGGSTLKHDPTHSGLFDEFTLKALKQTFSEPRTRRILNPNRHSHFARESELDSINPFPRLSRSALVKSTTKSTWNKLDPSNNYSESLPGSLPPGMYARPGTTSSKTYLLEKSKAPKQQPSRPKTAPQVRTHSSIIDQDFANDFNITSLDDSRIVDTCGSLAFTYISTRVIKQRVNILNARVKYLQETRNGF